MSQTTSFGRELRRLRRAADVTQRELDEQLKTTPGFIAEMEISRYYPRSVAWLKPALEILGCKSELGGMLALLAEDQGRIVFECDLLTEEEKEIVLSLQTQFLDGMSRNKRRQIAKVIDRGGTA